MRTSDIRRFVAASVAVACVASAASLAAAADYTLTRPTGLYEAPPAGATRLFLAPGAGKPLTPPFPISYFGRQYTTVGVSPYGYLQFGQVPTPTGASHEGFPTTSASFDGVCAIVWTSLRTGQGSTTSPNDAFAWTSGAGANRKWVVSWENITINTIGSRGTFQIQFHETSGRIVLAFAPDSTPTTWAMFEYSCGLDSPGDNRAIAFNSTNSSVGHPGADFAYDPRIDTFTGILRWDRIVSDATGIGNSVDAGASLGGVRVELRRDGTNLVNWTTTGADGTFSVRAMAVGTSSVGALVVPAKNSACVVANLAGQTREWTSAGSLAFGADVNVGIRSLGALGDADGSIREALNVARVLGAAREWAVAHTTATIAPVAVTLDPANGPGTLYQAGGPAMYVGGDSSNDPDAWDDSVLVRSYARHVLKSVAALPTAPTDDRFDVVSDTQNAFAEGFACWYWAVLSGATTIVNGTSPSSAVVRDLETPVVTVPKGPDVAGCVAGALFDLLDAANETGDPVDGFGTPSRVFDVVEPFTVCPTASTFLEAWATAGFGSAAITRVFVANGALVDDAFEPNDDRLEASALGAVGTRRAGLVLNRFNEDWFDVTLPAAAASLVADASFDRFTLDSQVSVEIRDATGALVATGAPVGGAGPIRATSGAVPAGSYRVGVKHVSGVRVPVYGVQGYTPLEMSAGPLSDWTVGRPYDQSLGAAGGVPPYTLASVGSALPPGLVFSPLNQHVVGMPTAAGAYPVTVQLRDDGVPSSAVSRSQTIVIHDELKIAIPEFIGLPMGRAVDATLPTTGGTPPFEFAVATGALPGGFVFAPNSLRITGTSAVAASSRVELDALDRTGSMDHAAMRAVVTVPMAGAATAAPLGAGDEACGWWFDAVAGSSVNFSVKTAKGRAKRTLAGVLLAPDRSVVATGTVKAKSGGLSASKLVCPQSGRYHFIASSAAGDATELAATLSLAPPKKGKLAFVDFQAGQTTTIEVGALAGAALVLKFSGDKKAGLVAKVTGLAGPDHAGVPFAAGIKASPLGGTLTIALPAGGTWTVTLGANSTSGTPGKLTASWSIKQPKGTYVADEE